MRCLHAMGEILLRWVAERMIKACEHASVRVQAYTHNKVLECSLAATKDQSPSTDFNITMPSSKRKPLLPPQVCTIVTLASFGP